MNTATVEPSTFKSIFFREPDAISVRVPDYQRAYSWESKQIELFLGDLVKYQGTDRGYYFGHFIAEKVGGGTEELWEIVDGQQRITTFVLFFMVCRHLSPLGAHASAFSMIQRFSTVSYDAKAFESICNNGQLSSFLDSNRNPDPKNTPSDKEVLDGLGLSEEEYTRSQRRMVLTLLRFHHAFQKGELKQSEIGGYINVVMNALCSHHVARCKSVAANIFEMQNTRGIPLSTLEVVKAKLMKYVYDNGGADCESKVKEIQTDFGDIYRMEEHLAARSFRGEITMEQLLRLHLRVVDDGMKGKASEFDSPALNANAEALIAYVDTKLEALRKNPTEGVKYAIDLAREFKKSVRIVSKTLPKWDEKDPMVGDVLILDRDLSCQLFLIVCRRLEQSRDQVDGRMRSDTLLLWERLLFTRDFHGEYHGLWYRDNFPALFETCVNEAQIAEKIEYYLENGFRPDRTKGKGLQSIVLRYLNENQELILNRAFYWYWWKSKMIYAIYKYEASKGANIREVMKGTISAEHILPQDWHWLMDEDTNEDLKKRSGEKWESFRKEIDGCINGIGNLLLITPGENTSLGNRHPADKEYQKYCGGGSYKEHDQNRELWRQSKEWPRLIQSRGDAMFKFMLETLVGASNKA